jgi:beta-lactam-binding protein with PASTA domain
MTEKEAKKALEDVGLQLEFKKSEEKETITDQLPKAGIKTKSGTIIIAQ